jgi:hypothetical protein
MTLNAPAITHTVTTPDQRTLYFNAQSHVLTISDNLCANYSFDREGRLLGAFRNGINYRRGLRGDVLMKHATAPRRKIRQMLSTAERRRLIAAVLDHVAAIHDQARPQQHVAVHPWLDRALAWDVERLEAERAAFHTIYKPISILPPDQYLALVLQAAEGCSWNRCSFCTLYQDRPFRIKTADALRRHIQQIKAFVGQAIGMRKSIFLGDANAMIIPQARLRELLNVVHEEFAIGPPNGMKGIYAFLDIFGAEQKSAADYRELHDAQVRRIYIGLESGDAEVFHLLNKPGSPAACIEAVHAIKAAGINVGIILLAGAGGAHLARQHVAHSLATLRAMGLGMGDIVYISPLIVPETSPYSLQLHAAGGAALDASAINVQLETIKTGARAMCTQGAKVALYHLEEFIY